MNIIHTKESLMMMAESADRHLMQCDIQAQKLRDLAVYTFHLQERVRVLEAENKALKEKEAA